MKKNIFRILIIILILITIPFPAFADYGTIQVDGYYDDWEDKPHTEVYPGKNPPESKINNVSLFRDEENVYIHVVFAHTNNQDIKNMTINLDTNLGGENYYIVADNWFEATETTEENLFTGSEEQTILLVADEEGDLDNNADTNPLETDTDPLGTDTEQVTVTEEGTADENITNENGGNEEVDTGLTEELNTKKPELYGTWSFSVYDELSSVGSGYYTRTEGESDELEMIIPLSSLTDQYDGITEISMNIKKLGKQDIICAGASAGPYIGVVISAGIAMLSVGAYSYKKKSKGRAH